MTSAKVMENRLVSRAAAVPWGEVAPGPQLDKSRTGIRGLDEITAGGLPTGRPTLVCGAAGSGKTLMAMEFLVRGAQQFDEPGVFVSFEETAAELVKNVASLGFDVDRLQKQKKLAIEYVHVERSEIEETGEYDLEGLFIRLGYAVDSIGAKRVVLDTIETLFSGLTNTGILRAELRRLFRWLKGKGLTAVVTAERGEGQLTRHGLEEYVSDCVILLDHRVNEQISTRRLRIIKYRGSIHGTNEYPFLIDATGMTVLPITSLGLQHKALTERVSTGVASLDEMLGGEGFFRGSSILISGTAGTGKTSIASCFAEAACRRGDKVLYFAFEESQDQIIRNMRSIGIDLAPHVRKGLLAYHASRPTTFGLEMHLAQMHKLIGDFQPAVVIVDPISNLISTGTRGDVTAMVTRLIDFLKSSRITSLFTSLTSGRSMNLEGTEISISSLMDAWLLLRDIEIGGERDRGIYVLKSRGMAHSNQIREFRLSEHGMELLPVYSGPEGVLTGTARLAQETREKAEQIARQQELERKQREMGRKRKMLKNQVETLTMQYEVELEELETNIREDQLRQGAIEQDREGMARRRGSGAGSVGAHNRTKRARKGQSR